MTGTLKTPHVALSRANGTCLQGYITISYYALVQRLGEPDELGSVDGKVQCRWVRRLSGLGRFPDGVLFTLYDYKESVPPQRLLDWHVGGRSRDALAAVQELFPGHQIVRA
jgi:hypothetical protein